MIHRHEFVAGPDLEKKIYQVFNSAKSEIIIISPYIKLFDKIKDELLIHRNNPNVEIDILFGKNFKWGKEDIEFIRSFPNIKVSHKENLHAKFYANERSAIITSMNLYESSVKNNYETGVFVEYLSEVESFLAKYWITGIIYLVVKLLYYLIVAPFMIILTLDFKLFERDKLTNECENYINDLISKSDYIVFNKVPVRGKGFLGLRKASTDSKIVVDRFDEMHFQNGGFCIRTGKPIEFNPNQPYSRESYFEWVNEGSNRNQKENFCHRTGKHSNGMTTINNPILYSST